MTVVGACVTVVRGPDAGTRMNVPLGSSLSIGASPSNELTLSDDLAARHHCDVTLSPTGAIVRACAASHIEARGVRANEISIEDSLDIEVGTSTIRVEVERQAPLRNGTHRFGQIVGASDLSGRLFEVLARLAMSDATVLLEGETGTGKTSIARAVHETGSRRRAPFVVIDCAAIPATLIEAELFGSERGAFTGANATRPGAFEAAGEGTIVLDEVGELPVELQPKLLGVLESKTIRRVGGSRMLPVPARVVATTNRDLAAMVEAGTFREDLFHRLDVVRLRIPSLRERPADIAPLARLFYRNVTGDDRADLPVERLEGWLRYDWPGNVRELRNEVERLALMKDVEMWEAFVPAQGTSKTKLETSNVSRRRAFDPETRYSAAKERLIHEWEQTYIAELLEFTGGNLSEAARVAGMDRTHLKRVMRRHGIEAPRA